MEKCDIRKKTGKGGRKLLDGEVNKVEVVKALGRGKNRKDE